MESTTAKPSCTAMSPRAKKILASLRRARQAAVKHARLHGVPIDYMRNGRIVRERVWSNLPLIHAQGICRSRLMLQI